GERLLTFRALRRLVVEKAPGGHMLEGLLEIALRRLGFCLRTHEGGGEDHQPKEGESAPANGHAHHPEETIPDGWGRESSKLGCYSSSCFSASFAKTDRSSNVEVS